MHSYTAQPGPTPDMNLSEAGDLFLKTQRERRRAKTVESNEGQLKRLVEHFGDIPLSSFHIGHFEHYQKTRGKIVAPDTVNHELNTLARILRLVDLWAPIKNRYNQLPPREWKAPKIFNAEEQEKLFAKLKGNPELELAEIVFTITRNTTASGCELRGLRLRNVELEADPPRIHIPPDSTKNNVRPRTIPLNEAAVAAFQRAIDRASRLGSSRPEHFLFPFRVNRGLWNPCRRASASWLRKQVVYLRELTGVEHINPHVFRHLAVTELFEKGAPEQTVIALAGWVSQKMIATYSHARIEAKADAVNLLTPSETPKPEKLRKTEPLIPGKALSGGFYVTTSTFTWRPL